MPEQKTEAATKPDPKVPAAPPPKGAPPAAAKPGAPPAPPAKEPAKAPPPSPEDRDRAEHTKALLKARKVGEELTSTRAELEAERKQRAELEKAIEDARSGGAKAMADLKKLIREDPIAAFQALEVDALTIGKTIAAKRGGKGPDPRDEAIEAMRKELEEIKGWRSKREEDEKKRAEEEQKRQEEAYLRQAHANVAAVTERSIANRAAKPAETDEERRAAAGDELLLDSLREESHLWPERFRLYAEKFPKGGPDDARAYFGEELVKLYLHGAERYAKLTHVGALTGGRTTDAPTDETGGKSRADAPRTITRKLSAERASETVPADGELSLKQRDELERASRRSMAATSHTKR